MKFKDYLSIVKDLNPGLRIIDSLVWRIWCDGHDAFTAAMALGESDLNIRESILAGGVE